MFISSLLLPPTLSSINRFLTNLHNLVFGRIWLACKDIIIHIVLFILCAKLLQSCLTPYDPMDCSPPRSSVHGILEARLVKWVAMPFSSDLPNPGIKPVSLTSPALADSSPLASPRKPRFILVDTKIVGQLSLGVIHPENKIKHTNIHIKNTLSPIFCCITLWYFSIIGEN